MKLSRHRRRAARRLVASCVFETLELRSLMSVVNVANYGAKPNDGINDLAAIQAAINASKPGDTILFSGGEFDLSGFGSGSGGNGLVLASGRTYEGQNGASLSGHDTNGPQLHVNGDNVTFSSLTFSGGGILFDKSGGYNTNITVDSCTFDLNTGGSNNNAITATSGLRSSTISNNYFTGYNGTFGIYGYGRDQLTVRNNEFVNISAGIHMESFNASDSNAVFEQNYFSGIKGMGIELQRYGINTIVQDNWYENPNLSSTASKNSNSMAYSIILDQSTGTIVQRNVVIDPQRPDGIGTRIGIEIGGDNALVEDNYMDGVNQSIAANDGSGTESITIENNQLINYLQGVGISFPNSTPPVRSMVATNNGPNVTLSSTMQQRIATNDKPGIGAKSYDNSNSNSAPNPTSPPTSPPPPPPPPPTSVDNSLPTVPAESDVTYLSDMDWTTMLNGWGPAERDMSNGEQAAGDGKTITLNGVSYAKGLGVHGGSDIQYQLDGEYSEFKTDMGVDDEVGSKGSVDFQVYLDGVLAYDSGTMTGASATQSLDLDVTGKQDIELVVTNANDGANFDHADWANARLLQAPAAESLSSTVDLSSLAPDSQSSGWGPIELNTSNGESAAGDGRVITLNGQTYDTGVGVHANSTLVYDLNGDYTSINSDVGVDDEVGSRGSVQFTVIVDGQTVFDSGVMTGASKTQSINIDLTGKQQLTLKVTSPTTNINFDHADWAGAVLTANA